MVRDKLKDFHMVAALGISDVEVPVRPCGIDGHLQVEHVHPKEEQPILYPLFRGLVDQVGNSCERTWDTGCEYLKLEGNTRADLESLIEFFELAENYRGDGARRDVLSKKYGYPPKKYAQLAFPIEAIKYHGGVRQLAVAIFEHNTNMVHRYQELILKTIARHPLRYLGYQLRMTEIIKEIGPVQYWKRAGDPSETDALALFDAVKRPCNDKTKAYDPWAYQAIKELTEFFCNVELLDEELSKGDKGQGESGAVGVVGGDPISFGGDGHLHDSIVEELVEKGFQGMHTINEQALTQSGSMPAVIDAIASRYQQLQLEGSPGYIYYENFYS
ncbi:hypothetical protein VKT23_003679 [Stygiomarasmius scandens]|uniref:Uncharacterized protein n=1 Tax=Marasmiellus scandens TaxID=2682957 RepID=A0ABR1K291_9AGAR